MPELKSYPWEIKGDWCKKSEEKFSGRYSMGIVRGSQYSEIVSSMTDLPQVSYLSFWIKYNLTETDGQYYCCYVQISLDGGKTWHDIEPIGGYPGVRPDIRVENNILYPKKKSFYGKSSGWIQVKFDLKPYVNKKIKIKIVYETIKRLTSTCKENVYVYIDDFFITPVSN